VSEQIKTKNNKKASTSLRLQANVFPTPHRSATTPKTSSQAAAAILRAFFSNRIGRKLILLALLMFMAGIEGCGSSPDPNRLAVFPVKGQIAFKSKPTDGAFVVLHPKGAIGPNVLRPHGYVRKDGTFSLSTYDTNDGAPAGEYKMTVERRNLVKRPNGDFSPGPNVLPRQYSRPDTSPVAVRIAEGDNALPPIVLK
jgi:hypothetical protein